MIQIIEDLFHLRWETVHRATQECYALWIFSNSFWCSSRAGASSLLEDSVHIYRNPNYMLSFCCLTSSFEVCYYSSALTIGAGDFYKTSGTEWEALLQGFDWSCGGALANRIYPCRWWSMPEVRQYISSSTWSLHQFAGQVRRFISREVVRSILEYIQKRWL